MDHDLTFDAEGRVAEIVIHGAEQNSLDGDGIRQLESLLETARRTPTLRAVIVTGSGADFCGGRNRDRSLVTAPEIMTDLQPILDLNAVFDTYPVPLIAAVEGAAFGFGFGLAMLSDVTVAAAGARFALTELAHGIPPLIVFSYLFRLLPYKVALDLGLSGRELDAREAERLGLVSEVVAGGAALGRAREIARRTAESDPAAVALLRSYARKNAALIDEAAAREGAEHIAGLLATGAGRA